MKYLKDKGEFCRYLYQNCSCVNAGQSLEERKMKYLIIRANGIDYKHAYRMRDWRRINIAKYFGFKTWLELLNNMENQLNGTKS